MVGSLGVVLVACGGEVPVGVAAAGVSPSALTSIELLGKKLFFDKQLSSPPGQSCAACHAPLAGWTGPNPGINRAGAVYPGAVRQRFGNRMPPSAAYATQSPIFNYDDDEEMFIGGNFWDGRASGETLGSPAAEQALGPFLNPVEQNNASMTDVCQKVALSTYRALFEEVWGAGTLDCSVDGVTATYDLIGLAIAAYEASSEVNQFSSKYDYSLAGLVALTEQEAWGLELFEGTAMCAAWRRARAAELQRVAGRAIVSQPSPAGSKILE